MSAQLEKLVKERGILKSSLTRHQTYYENINLEVFSDDIARELEARLGKLEQLFDSFSNKQTEIELLDFDKPEKLDEQLQEREKFESLYFKLVGKIRSELVSFFNSPDAHNVSLARLPAEGAPRVRSKGVELPTLKLPNFSGQFENWIEFRDGFNALIHENATLSSIQKFYYLRSCMNKDALALIESITVTEGNYKIAWDILCDRYEQTALLIHNHVRALFEYPKIEFENHLSLRTFFDTMTKNLRALKVLGEETEKWDRLLIYLFTSKLDKVSRKEWELYKISGDLPTLDDFNAFLKQRCELLEKIDNANKPCGKQEGKQEDKRQFTRGNKFNKYQSGSYASTYQRSNNNMSCYFCKDRHSIFQCQRLLSLSPANRCTEVSKVGLCKNCLRPGHNVFECIHSGCKQCNRRHNTLLHVDFAKKLDSNRDSSDVARVRENKVENNRDIKSNESNIEFSNQANQAAVLHASSSENNASDIKMSSSEKNGKIISSEVCTTASTSACKNEQVVLSTAIVYVKDTEGNLHECRALLDSGSQSNFVTERICKLLNLARERVDFKIVGVGESTTKLSSRVNLKLFSCNSSYKTSIDCLVLGHITDRLPTVTFSKTGFKLPSNIGLADYKFNQSSEIDLLLGSSIFWELLQGGKIHIDNSKLFLQETLLGWVIGGVTSNVVSSSKYITCFSSELKNDNCLDKLLTKFWELEEIDSKVSPKSKSDNYCEDNFLQTVNKTSEGNFVVSIPFKDNLCELGDSRENALKRYFSQEQRLIKNSYLKGEYDKFMNEYLELGHMREVDEGQNKNTMVYYMPHHAVVREHSKTTKVRVVFDASMKTRAGLSLNDVQHVGPTLQADLFTIILRFRKYRYVMSADILKMYRMIFVEDKQRSLQRIFWRENTNQDLRCFELNTVTYGTASAPYLAVRCLFQLASDFESIYPKAGESIRNCFYMDDFLEGADSVTELLELQEQVSTILSSAGFQLRKWLCNDRDLLNNFQVNKDLDSSILNITDGGTNKTLGILWDSNLDTFQYSVPDFKYSHIITKRSILSAISQIYDPLHMLAPVVVVLKLLMQSLWQGLYGWDEELPREFINTWIQFKNALPKIINLKIPRMVTVSNYISIELHGFGDASQKAYGCCLYVRCQVTSGQYFSHLLCAKSRVAPIKKLVTLPRLELCASLLLAQLAQKAIDSLKINFNKCYFYSDSQIVLSWVRGSVNKWKLFVANRVSEIQQLTDINDWHHVSTDQNPADLISRGLTVDEIIVSTFWWNGPEWLRSNNLNNVINKEVFKVEDIPEQKTITNTVLIKKFDIFTRFSSLGKLKRVFAYCLRFIYNSKPKNCSKRKGMLTIDELNNSLYSLVKLAQQESFPVEYEILNQGSTIKNKSNLLSLNPIFDKGLMRVGGRLQNSNYDFDKKFPIILPSKHILTDLILRYEHITLLHGGPSLLLASIRERFWPISGRNVCKKIIRECVTCFKVNPTASQYIMGNLPEVRVNQYLPFVNTGCDFAGPFWIKDRLTRNAKLTKAYVCIFICMSTKAIHLEVMSDLTTNCFMAAFRRFVSRRGKPHSVYSDNGKTFVRANKELKELHAFLQEQAQSERFNYFISEQNISWHFIPSRAPNFGGIWEAGVKSFKFHFKRVVGEAHLNLEDFNTILVQVESILNSRPLCPLSPCPDQLNPLTPAHFLVGRSLTALPDQDVTEIKANRLKRFTRLQQIIQHFWVRWKKEYLHELQVRCKWQVQPALQLKPGVLVLVVEDFTPPLKWPMGKIELVHPGKDGIVRVVTVRMNNKLLKRPVSKICVMPINLSASDETVYLQPNLPRVPSNKQ